MGLLANSATSRPNAATDFDAAKVDRIKLAIAAGTLSVNAVVVADRLIAGTVIAPRHARREPGH